MLSINKMKKKLDVEHYLGIYKLRLRMNEEDTNNPSNEAIELFREIVDKLSKMPLDEPIILDKLKMKDSKGNIIVEFPK